MKQAHRNISIIQFISSFISTFITFTFVYLSQDYFGLGEYSVLFIVMSGYIPYLAIGIHVGYWCDSYELNKIINAVGLAFFLPGLLLIPLIYSDVKIYAAIALPLGAFVVSAIILIIGNALGSAIPRIFPREEWKKENASLMFYRNIGLVVGPIAGGLIIGQISVGFTCLIFLLSGLITVNLSRGFIDTLKSNEITINQSFISMLKESLTPLFRNRALGLMLAHGSFSNFVTGMIEVSIYILLSDEYGFDPKTISILFFLRQAGGVVAAKYLSHIDIKLPIKIQLLFVSFINGLLWLTIGMQSSSSTTFLIIGSCLFVISINSAIFNIVMSTFRQSVVTSEEQGRSLAAVRFILFSSFIPGVLFGYLFLELLEIRGIYIISGLLVAGSAIFLLKINSSELSLNV
jgi:MFS family permease